MVRNRVSPKAGEMFEKVKKFAADVWIELKKVMEDPRMQPTGEELAEAEKEWSCVMKSPSTNKHYLAVIDEAMVLKKKERKP